MTSLPFSKVKVDGGVASRKMSFSQRIPRITRLFAATKYCQTLQSYRQVSKVIYILENQKLMHVTRNRAIGEVINNPSNHDLLSYLGENRD